MAPVHSPAAAATTSRRQILERYKHVGDDQLRYMQKWGLIRPQRVNGESVFGFVDLAIIRQADAEIAEGASFRAVLRNLLASRANAALIAAGTGLGEALLHRMNGRLVPIPSEGGHADFGARTDRELELVRMLRERYGRASVEHVVSGRGLLNLHAFTHRGGECMATDGVSDEEKPAHISAAAMTGRCQGCVEAMRMLATAYGAEAGNLALRGLALAGVYIGGGIAPKILPLLRSGFFMEAFRDKGEMADLVARVPVRVILNPDAGLLGAAVYAQSMLD